MTDPTTRALTLLGLLQARPMWTGAELAGRLGVTERSIRRDVERLRGLGYPVQASNGVGGGYHLVAGRALPPLLLDDEEAVAVAVCLRIAAGGTVEGLGEAAVRTLAKLDQVLPARLRATVAAVHDATVSLAWVGETVDADTLLVLARGCRENERVSFAYAAGSGARSARRVEPHRVVTTGRRWYLMAYDLDREDWRTFRLDRMAEVVGTGWRFRPRPAPDAADFVQRAVSQVGYEHVARVVIEAPLAVVARAIPPSVGTVDRVDDDRCVLTAGGNDLSWLAMHLARLDWPMTVEEPAELRAEMRRLATRLRAAAR